MTRILSPRRANQLHGKNWLTIAIAFETEPGKRTNKQRQLTDLGLCHAGAILGELFRFEGHLIRSTRNFASMGPDAYWFPIPEESNHTRNHDLLRATFAGFMAALTVREFEEMLKG